MVSRKRADGVPLARAQGATVILMDDGFQNPAIVKDASLIVIDGERGLGNGQVFPAGPLRAPLRPQLARTDALIVVGDGGAAGAVAAEIAAQGKPVLSAHLKPDEARSRSFAASACWRLPASAIPRDSSTRCAPAASKWPGSAPSPIIIRFRKPRSKA